MQEDVGDVFVLGEGTEVVDLAEPMRERLSARRLVPTRMVFDPEPCPKDPVEVV
jgi:hypothetical protein